MKSISVCVLCYGDYPELARRCLDSLRPFVPGSSVVELRIGLNAPGASTLDFVCEQLAPAMARHVPVSVYVSTQNVGKYPLMRRMFYPSARVGAPMSPNFPGDGLRGDWTMWFDDDSYLTWPQAASVWWQALAEAKRDAHMIGALYFIHQRGAQWRAIPKQPWYGGKPLGPNYKFRFVQGAWWLLDTGILTRHDWPIVELHHNGGDSLLGELLRQQGLIKHQFNSGVAINFDAKHGGESRAKRRGLQEEPWPFQVPGPPDLSYHNFECEVMTWGGTVPPLSANGVGL